MKRISLKLLILLIGFVSLYGDDGKSLANKYNINPSSKASIQWDRLFKNEQRMAKLGIDKLSIEEKKTLLRYLINHSADSDTPAVAGM